MKKTTYMSCSTDCGPAKAKMMKGYVDGDKAGKEKKIPWETCNKAPIKNPINSTKKDMKND